MSGKLIFITGGVRSGKSAFAEQLLAQYSTAASYIATSEPFDEEMKARIARHQQDRAGRAVRWTTYEAPVTLPYDVVGDAILIECVTTWLSNVLYYEMPLASAKDALVAQLLTWRKQGYVVVVVSNELLDEGQSPYAETEYYKQELGMLHQQLVKWADEAYEIQFSLVQRWK